MMCKKTYFLLGFIFVVVLMLFERNSCLFFFSFLVSISNEVIKDLGGHA